MKFPLESAHENIPVIMRPSSRSTLIIFPRKPSIINLRACCPPYLRSFPTPRSPKSSTTLRMDPTAQIVEPSGTVESNEVSRALSKNAAKRQAKMKKWEESRESWKAKNREKKKAARQRKRKECVENGMDIPKRFKPNKDAIKIGSILFDFEYNGLMKETEISSLCSQISRCYAFNRRSTKPFNLSVVGFRGEVADKFAKNFPDYERWDVSFMPENLQEMTAFDKSKLLYLSGDADDVLESIDDDTIYIIGGIVDRNRHKGASLARALKHGIRCARLPISENVQLKSSTILTVIHVFEILNRYRENGCWKKAIEETIPVRKIDIAPDGDDAEPN